MPNRPPETSLTDTFKWASRAQYGASEIEPIDFPGRQARRLNVFLSYLSQKWSFGGISTALRLFDEMAKEFDYARIIVSHEDPSLFEAEHWPSWNTDPRNLARRSILFLGEKDSKTVLTLSSADFFLVTTWPSAIYCEYVLSRQAELFSIPRRRCVYFIQDYAPGYMPWSLSHAYADSTYRDDGKRIVIFNSSQLAEFFSREGFRFAHSYIYEPMALPELRRSRMDLTSHLPKGKLILVYARPDIPRNGFDAIVGGLRMWATNCADARSWCIISDGDPHPDIDLSNGVTLKSRGRASLEEYVDYLRRCWVGISLVFSPHPGYTVLEIADFGAWTITNRWKTKDPSALAPNILAVDTPSPEAIAERLVWACGTYLDGQTAVAANIPPLLRYEGEEFPFLSSILKAWSIP